MHGPVLSMVFTCCHANLRTAPSSMTQVLSVSRFTGQDAKAGRGEGDLPKVMHTQKEAERGFKLKSAFNSFILGTQENIRGHRREFKGNCFDAG